MSLPLPLVERLVGLFTEGHTPQVLEGRLPDLIVSLPLPEGTTVSVSYILQPSKHHFYAVAALDTPLALEAFLEQMSTRLISDGWKRNEPEPYRSLFLEPSKPHFYPFSWAQPFFKKGGMVLMVEGAEEKGEGVPTEVRLSISMINLHSECKAVHQTNRARG